MKRTRRRAVLAVALGSTLAATGAAWWRDGGREADVATAPTAAALPARAPQAASRPPADATRPVTVGDAEALTLFDPAPWSSPPAVQAPTQTAAAPQVALVEAPAGPPPLPFRPLGRFDDNQGPVVFLVHGDQNLVVRKGERFADGYRLEEINGTVVGIRHLATGQLQTLDLGSGS